MAILFGPGKKLFTDDGIPYMWQSGDVTTTPNEVGIITASDGAADDRFGNSVAAGSGRIVVGAYWNDDNGSSSGSAYIFDLDGNEVGIITASNGAAGDGFGVSVAEGSGRIVVGAPYNNVGINTNQGAAYIYDLEGNEVGIITASDGAAYEWFGWSVAVGSGKIVVGAPYNRDNGTNSGSAYIFNLDGNEVGIITGGYQDLLGQSVALGSGRIVVGAPYDRIGSNNSQGSAWIYDLDGNQLGIITASDGEYLDHFGWSVAEGSGKIVVGAYRKNDERGSAYIYDTPPVYTLYDAIDLNYG